MGYHRAGFDVVGVDVKPQPHYPFTFIQADFRTVAPLFPDFDAIHASPPCQRWSTATKRNGTQDSFPDFIAEVRELLRASDVESYVIENVPAAPLIDPVTACGTALMLVRNGYRLRRHRCFESNIDLHMPPCACAKVDLPVLDVTGGGPSHAPRLDGGGGRPYKGTANEARALMGMPWATKAELNEAIPPAYTECIGRQILEF